VFYPLAPSLALPDALPIFVPVRRETASGGRSYFHAGEE
jgi:hypothetical protein